MKCPHCTVTIQTDVKRLPLGEDASGAWIVEYKKCPACSRFIIYLISGSTLTDDKSEMVDIRFRKKSLLVYPRSNSRPPCPLEVPKEIAQEYTEACITLNDSPTASAALSRRCLQHFLRDVAKVRPDDLSKEIQQVIDSGKLPSYIADAIDAVRNIGNFAAHPMKSQSSGEILPVETTEAEWNLEVLEALFDFYCVQPAAVEKKKRAFNLKLRDAGKRPIK